MENQNYEMALVGKEGGREKYRLVPAGITRAGFSDLKRGYPSDTITVYDEDEWYNTMPLTIRGKEYKYVQYGMDDMLPFQLLKLTGDNLVMSRCMEFNVVCSYGQGARFVSRDDGTDVTEPEIRDFCLRNSLHRLFMEQVTDFQRFGFSVVALILSRDGKRVARLRHKDACFCRMEAADRRGRVRHVFYGDFRPGHFDPDRVEVLELLDPWDPLGDLMVRMGRERDPDTGKYRKQEETRKFAMLVKQPVAGCPYYPIPPYSSVFRDAWYDIYSLIGKGKKALIKNTSAPRVQIEVHSEYWNMVCDLENIIDPAARVRRIEQEKRNIVDFVTGPDNAGKALISGYYIDPNGKEARMVRVYDLNEGRKQGGDWSEDSAEASNFICFAMGVHPNLVGATPGKSQMNNSGSDKRELFTLKQVIEKPTRDLLCAPYHVVLHYNGWDKRGITVDVPMLVLTTLDENTDLKAAGVGNGKGGKKDKDNNEPNNDGDDTDNEE